MTTAVANAVGVQLDNTIQIHFSYPLRLRYAITGSIIVNMSNAEKLLEKMRNNPRDWRIESLQTVARAYEIAWRQQGTSHVVFVRQDGRTLPVPAHRPIKPLYIKKFVVFVTG